MKDEVFSGQETIPASARLASLDAYRGLVMLLMMGEALSLWQVAQARPDSALWRLLAHHQSHAEWVGCSLHDLIQPSFSFLVGVALPFSLASRAAHGQSRARMTLHAAWRALVLILLGAFLASVNQPQTCWDFEDTLSQIGLGYVFLFLLGLRPARDQRTALAVILAGYWAAFALYPLPGPGFAYSKVGVPNDWPYLLPGFAAHWNKNSNLASAFDTWFLNLFPRHEPFRFHPGGYATLSFIPTLGTMILGLIAGNVIRGPRAPSTLRSTCYRGRVVKSAMARGHGRHSPERRGRDGLAGHLPRSQAHLDSKLDAIQRGLVSAPDGGVLRAD